MKLVKKVNALALGLAVLLAVSCGKDDDEGKVAISGTNGSTNQNCRFTGLLESTGAEGETYIYNAQGKVEKFIPISNISANAYQYLVDYSLSGEVTKISFLKNNQMQEYYTYEYDANGLLKREKQFINKSTGNPPQPSLHAEQVYTFNSNKKLSTIIRKSVLGADSVFYQTNYFYPSAKAVRMERSEIVNGILAPPEFIDEYTLDSMVNPKALLGLPFFVNEFENNILTINRILGYNSSPSDHKYVYQYNGAGYPVTVTYSSIFYNTTKVLNYTYNCQ